MQRRGAINVKSSSVKSNVPQDSNDNLSNYSSVAKQRKYGANSKCMKVFLSSIAVLLWFIFYSSVSTLDDNIRHDADSIAQSQQPPPMVSSSSDGKPKGLLLSNEYNNKDENHNQDAIISISRNENIVDDRSSALALEKVEAAHNEATKRMLETPSSFVDGEKLLKLEMRKVMERQKNGIDVGVKVSGGWLDGEPVVFPGEIHKN